MKKFVSLALTFSLSSVFSMAAMAGTPTVSESGNFEQKTGEDIFNSICQGCHMEQGKGANTGAGFYPALAGNPSLTAPAYPIFVLLNGLGGMPSFKEYLSDEQILEVVNYIRSDKLGNSFPTQATMDDVKALSGR